MLATVRVAAKPGAETERRVEAVRAALKGSDLAVVKSSTDALVEQLQKVGTAAYQIDLLVVLFIRIPARWSRILARRAGASGPANPPA